MPIHRLDKGRSPGIKQITAKKFSYGVPLHLRVFVARRAYAKRHCAGRQLVVNCHCLFLQITWWNRQWLQLSRLVCQTINFIIIPHDTGHKFPGMHFIGNNYNVLIHHTRLKYDADIFDMRMSVQRVDEKNHHIAQTV